MRKLVRDGVGMLTPVHAPHRWLAQSQTGERLRPICLNGGIETILPTPRGYLQVLGSARGRSLVGWIAEDKAERQAEQTIQIDQPGGFQQVAAITAARRHAHDEFDA